jgi:hypothetical protein
MCEWTLGEDALTPDVRKERKRPRREFIRISGGSYLNTLFTRLFIQSSFFNRVVHHLVEERRNKKAMPPKKLKNQLKRAASIGLQTVSCCDACRGPGTRGTNGRPELMRAQFGLRCRWWGLCVCQRICFFCIIIIFFTVEHLQRMVDGERTSF